MALSSNASGSVRRIAVVRHGPYPADSHLRRNVLALRDAGFSVDLICDRDPGRPRLEHVDGITVLRTLIEHKRHSKMRYLLEYAALPFMAAATMLLRAVRGRYQYVEIDNPPDWLILAGMIPKLTGAKVTMYIFDNIPELLASDYGLSPYHPLMWVMLAALRTGARLSDGLIAPHRMVRHNLIRQGVRPEKIVAVVPNVPDERVFLSQATTPRSHPAADGAGFRLVTHGSLLKRYGIETLLEAVSLARVDIPTLHLDILGDGDYRATLEEIAARLDLGQRVSFLGMLPFAEVAPRLQQADVGVVPMWADFVPNKLMEYLALGLPAISSDSPALRFYLDDDALCYVPPKDARALAAAIVMLYRDPVRRAALAECGHQVFTEHLSWTRTRHEYLAVYDVVPSHRCVSERSASSTAPL
ncbi:MAG: glycosyltransferase family 4 protein [Chloroflexota bacterium]|nr:glycosyltransferase family 4 protein [Chloroflexota bacterium]